MNFAWLGDDLIFGGFNGHSVSRKVRASDYHEQSLDAKCGERGWSRVDLIWDESMIEIRCVMFWLYNTRSSCYVHGGVKSKLQMQTHNPSDFGNTP